MGLRYSVFEPEQAASLKGAVQEVIDLNDAFMLN